VDAEAIDFGYVRHVLWLECAAMRILLAVVVLGACDPTDRDTGTDAPPSQDAALLISSAGIRWFGAGFSSAPIL